MHAIVFRISVLVLIFGISLSPAAAQPTDSDILIIDVTGGAAGAGALFRVDPQNGMRTLVSEFGQAAQGPVANSPIGLALESSGDALVMTFTRLLFRVNTETGARTIVSDFRNAAQGPIGMGPRGVTVGQDGAIFVADSSSRLVFQVDPATGMRTIVSNFTDAAQGPAGLTPFGIHFSTAGELLVADQSLTMGNLGGVFAVSPATGARVVVSDFGSAPQGPTGRDPIGIDTESSGRILVADAGAGSGTLTTAIGALFRVDRTTGSRVLLSDLNAPSQGVVGWGPTGVAVEDAGTILMTTQNRAGSGARHGLLFRVDPSTGFRTLLSDFGDPSQGPLGEDPFEVAVVPVNSMSVTIDIKPGSDENPINRRSRGNVPVALLSSLSFDATAVDRRGLLFAGVPPLNIGRGIEDVNGDGLPDIVLHFDTQRMNLPPGATEACLTGQTPSGQEFIGCDSVSLK
jgi:hypothetical protein